MRLTMFAVVTTTMCGQIFCFKRVHFYSMVDVLPSSNSHAHHHKSPLPINRAVNLAVTLTVNLAVNLAVDLAVNLAATS